MTTSEPASTPAPPSPQRSKGFVIGRVAGAPVIVTRSWFLAAFILTILFVPAAESRVPGLGAGAYLVAFMFVLLLFGSVFLHETAHALVARARGQNVTELAVTLWGGHTAYTGGLGRPLDGFLVAVVGPLTNLALAAGFLFAYQASPVMDAYQAPSVMDLLQGSHVMDVPTFLLWAGAASNALVGAFNLLPGLPLDGGQILESLVWAVTGRRTTGTVVAGWVGRVVAVGVLLWALVLPYVLGTRPDIYNVLWSALIGALLWAGAGAAITNGRRREAVARLSAAGLAGPAALVPLGATVADALDARAAAGGGVPSLYVVVVTHDGVPIAVLDADAVAAVPATARAQTQVDAVAVPFAPGSAIHPELAGTELLTHLAQRSGGARLVPVVDAGRVTGVLDLADVARAVRAT
ncbi:Zn-dependent protease (includes SpoIVFB) [Promicromonospora umidemergens]|uniref:Peptidase M50 domain-containing protein n=1 Tax=Promicromonospora umidemergens TaxID=629679 RepID=A0ABP8YFN7_9MICO|nr:site-2 protease family protein [Promicromonospora umidemergens]MCP2286606.1 Zn-dependent protease (includes SpoIVFB) [Promicromonospora umidemergens]